ncbi:hypothetical protein IU431_06665 [Nocardia otitidiscaviarum]|uniref:hypothetical protein n=1 Tax=Nocardia otitidiscaviarum TaxID=1823 RepID=UPI0004A6E273|nr:hypothetical protein [Nocardia otitidiscaviarum]MBF6483839.1 hypothetical protein [Nocardia otitidiscaviarum]
MPYNPVPYLVFDGERVECDADLIGTAPLALAGIKVDWGRDDYISHARPGTAQLSILDRTGTWAAKVSAKQVIGRTFELWWEHSGGASQRWFAGRVTGAVARPANLDSSGGWVVALTAAARDADLGNVIMAPGTWPTETMIVRANRIADAAVPAGIDEFYFYPGSVDIQCWPLDVKGRDLHALCDEFYMSMGDTYSYHPHTNVIRHLYRRSYDALIYLVQMPDGLVYVQAGNTVYDSQTYKGTGLPGCETYTDDGIELAPNSVVTRVQVGWKDAPGGLQDVTTVAQTPEGDSNGRRTVQITSWIDNGIHIDPMVAEVLARGTYEGALPKHPPVTWDTRRTGGFHSQAEAEVFTLAAETQGVVYISSSIYSAWLPNIIPICAIIGGTIEYDGGWIITTTLQYVWKTNTTALVVWNQLATSLQWRTGATGQLSPSVSWNDFRYLTHPLVYAPS